MGRAVAACMDLACEALAVKRSMCDRHYKAWSREQSKCGAGGCNAMLLPAERSTRSDYCRLHERLALTNRSPAAQEKTLNRFREGIEPDWVYGCWMWREVPNQDGYGQMHAGTPWLAHRFSYVWFYGGHKRLLTLDHLCNRTRCVRPDHMQAISRSRNIARRDKRAFAPALKPFDVGFAPSSQRADEWAQRMGLPFGNPVWLEARLAMCSVTTSSPHEPFERL